MWLLQEAAEIETANHRGRGAEKMLLPTALRLLLAAGAAADVDVFTAGQGEGSAGCESDSQKLP